MNPVASAPRDRPPPAASFRAVFEAAPYAVILADNARRYVDGNRAALALLGISRRQFLRRRIDDFAAAPRRVPAAWRAFLKKGRQRGRFHIRRADGTLCPVNATATPHFRPSLHLFFLWKASDDDDGDVNRQRRFRHVIDAAPVLVVDPRGRIVLAWPDRVRSLHFFLTCLLSVCHAEGDHFAPGSDEETSW